MRISKENLKKLFLDDFVFEGKVIATNVKELREWVDVQLEADRATRNRVQSDIDLVDSIINRTRAEEEDILTLEEAIERNKELAEEEEKRSEAAAKEAQRRRRERIDLGFKDLQTLLKTDLTGAFEDFQRELEKVDEREKSLRESIGDVNQEISNYRKEIQEIKDEEGPVTEEQQEQINRYKERIGDATGTLGELRGELGELPDAINEVREAWDRQTKEMILDLATQRLAVGGLTSDELTALGRLAGPEGFDLIDESSARLIEGIGLAADAMDAAGGDSDIFLAILEDLQLGIGDTTAEVDALSEALNNLPTAALLALEFGTELPGLRSTRIPEFEEGVPTGVGLIPGGDTVTNEGDNFNLTINTSAPQEDIIADFRMMSAMGDTP